MLGTMQDRPLVLSHLLERAERFFPHKEIVTATARPLPAFQRSCPSLTPMPRGIAPGAIWHICRRRAEQSGLTAFSPHDLRRSCVTDLLDQDVDLVTVSQFLGHAKTDTTRKYDHRGDRAKRRAATRLHIPSARRGGG